MVDFASLLVVVLDPITVFAVDATGSDDGPPFSAPVTRTLSVCPSSLIVILYDELV